MNKAKYDAMSPAQKKVIDEHCTNEWAVKVASPFADFEKAGRAKMLAAPGHEVYPVTPEQLKAWRAVVAPLHKQWADAVTKAGGNPDEIFKELQDNIAKNGAGI
jgi:TRAP-type C4-dicarboxylate transport system substrate-binding protein